MLVLGIAFWLLMNRHRFGSHVLFVGDNMDSSRMMGINVERVKTIVFMQMGFFAAFAGILSTLEVTYFWPSQGQGYLLTTLAAVFIGGTSVFGGMGTIFGTFTGRDHHRFTGSRHHRHRADRILDSTYLWADYHGFRIDLRYPAKKKGITTTSNQ